MRKVLVLGFVMVCGVCFGQVQGTYSAYNQLQPLGGINYSSIYYLSNDIEIKSAAKEISQFRAKEFIINNIIGETEGKEIKFETESLASDDTGGLVSIAYNCTEKGKKGLLLGFVGFNKNQVNVISKAYGFRDIPLEKAKDLLNRLDNIRKANEKYILKDSNVNNVYLEFEDIKFVIYYDVGSKIRVLWNGFEIVWEDTAFGRSKRRLNRWFE